MKLLPALLVFIASSATLTAQSGIDLVIVNANVHTMALDQPRAEAIAVSGGEIVAVGSSKTILALADADTKRVDAKGKLVLPGFNDAHVHFAAIGNIFSSIKLSDIRTPKEFTERIASFSKFLPKGRWILGSGWDNRNWLPNDPPTRALIDSVSPDNPIFIYNWDAKAVMANASALKAAGIDGSTKDPPGGTILRDDKGEATGVLRGTAIQIVGSKVPTNHMRNWPEVVETASKYAASFGITSVQDMHSDDLASVYQELAKHGKLKTRVYDCITLTDWKKLAIAKMKAAAGDAMVRTGCVKFFAEEEAEDIAQLERDIIDADKAGLQVAMHAIGAKPVETVLNIFEKASKANGDRDRRFRVEHAARTSSADLPRFAKLKVIASMQPWLFFGENGSGTDDYKRIFELGTLVSIGSDASITDFDPIMGIHAAVNSKHGISVEQAVSSYTLGSAYAEFQETQKGSIQVGKLADFVILSEDIFTIDRSKIKNTRVNATILNGIVIYQN